MAKQRHAVSRKLGVEDRKRGKQSADFIDLQGVAGEFAFCKLFNIYPDTNIISYAPYDCVAMGVGTVEVKTTEYPNGRLSVPLGESGKVGTGNKDKCADYYVLMTGNASDISRPVDFTMAGWVAGADLLIRKRVGWLPGIEKTDDMRSYIIEQHELCDPEEWPQVNSMQCSIHWLEHLNRLRV